MKNQASKWLSYAIALLCIVGIAMTVYLGNTSGSGFDTPQEPIARYYGNCHAGTDMLIYDFQIIQDTAPVLQISFTNYLDDADFQTLTYQLRDDFMPPTVRDGIEIMDVNGDGSDDFLFDLGVYGKMRLKACLVYDHEAKQYVFVDGFEELNAPIFVNGCFITAPMPMDVPVTKEKYSVVGTELCHVGKLFIYENDTQTLYTEQRQENGVWMIEKEMVTESDIDLFEWGKPTE